ncbi:MAG: hypothetical protein R6V12_06700, partial [Candidatus Hydrogenedentota bacterium]
YANGAEALPHVILDAEAVAWVLWLCAKHAEQLPSDARATFAKEVGAKIEAAAEFLEAWSDPRTGLPRTAFNPDELRDAPSPELAIHTYMGLQSALALAALSGQERPDWRKRAQELQAIIRARYVDDDGFWRLENPERFWNVDLVPSTHPRWLPILQQSLKSLNLKKKASPHAAGEALFAAAMLSPSHTGIRKEIRAILEKTRTDNPADSDKTPLAFPPDSYIAALRYLAWEKITEKPS